MGRLAAGEGVRRPMEVVAAVGRIRPLLVAVVVAQSLVVVVAALRRMGVEGEPVDRTIRKRIESGRAQPVTFDESEGRYQTHGSISCVRILLTGEAHIHGLVVMLLLLRGPLVQHVFGLLPFLLDDR